MDIEDEKLPVKVKPYRHQIEAYRFVCNLFGLKQNQPISRGAALLMEMGCGKSLTAVMVTVRLFKLGLISRVLIVAPLSILGVWKDEFSKFSDFAYNLTVLTGSMAEKTAALHRMDGRPLQIAVVNYESAWRMESELLGWNPDLAIADEGHKLKTHSNAASKTMHKLGAKARYRLLLTGTVITNKAIDVFSQYKFLNPSVFGASFYTFRNRYFDMTGYGNHTPVLKKSIEQELTSKIHSIAYRATKAECLDLPGITEIVRHVELEPAATKAYQSLIKDSYIELAKGEVTVTNVLTKLLRLSQLTGGFLGTDGGDRARHISDAKLKALEDILEEAAEEARKVVIIARFLPEIDAICRLIEKLNLRFSIIKGGVNDREEQIRQFQTDPDVTVFVGQIATAGLGITLTAASIMVFYSLDYSMSNFEQTKARIHRVGQKDNCTYLYLTARNTVDEKVLQALRAKADLAKTLIDDYRNGVNPFQMKG